MSSEYKDGLRDGKIDATLDGLAEAMVADRATNKAFQTEVMLLLRGAEGRNGLVGDVQALKLWREQVGSAAKIVLTVLTSGGALTFVLKAFHIV